ncbi:uncharacterized protein LOC126835882 [Adelges cooleyi]|uniref:uncharacterized protein LOC126835882 n=1 Tax=Adelges cooleyi TaxID=133065 RepID=UPI00218005A5|nr:uncharacterized protein LOC126835882 [Adelges cooleyi]
MANLFNRVKPTIIFCTIFGQGIPYSNTKKSSWEYWLLLMTNIAISSYTTLTQYTVIILLIHHGIRTINEEITTIRQWKSCRTRWKELKNLAEYLTTSVFGLVIILFIWCSMGDVLFFCIVTFQSFKANMNFRSYVEYASLYMIHTGFKLMPCGIFELSFNQLFTIFTVLAAFLALQIQMKLLDSQEVIILDF